MGREGFRPQAESMEKNASGRARLGGDSGPEWRGWCRTCSGSARCRQGPKLTNRCRPEKTDTNEYLQMLRVHLKLEEGRVPGRNATGQNIEGEKRKVTRKECMRLREKFGVGGLMAQKKVCVQRRRRLDQTT